MMSTPTTSAFDHLLVRLDREPAAASVKYEELRQRITKILHWKGCPESESDALADLTLDRIAEKLAAGTEIDNLNAYAAGVIRFIWLEHSRRYREDAAGDDLPETAVEPEIGIFEDADERLGCLRKCLGEVAKTDDDRRLIIGYYDTEQGGKNKDIRKNLADTFGISVSTLKVRACRLRAALEACINGCMARVTNSAKNDTDKREAMQQ
jgi:DNA-directed RNA polymerase specialized sigma24 family protein